MNRKKIFKKTAGAVLGVSLLLGGAVSVLAAESTEYPLTVMTYDQNGNEVETTYEKAPERVLAVYQGCVETMLALGLEDHLVATAAWTMLFRTTRQKPLNRPITWMNSRPLWKL